MGRQHGFSEEVSFDNFNMINSVILRTFMVFLFQGYELKV